MLYPVHFLYNRLCDLFADRVQNELISLHVFLHQACDKLLTSSQSFPTLHLELLGGAFLKFFIVSCFRFDADLPSIVANMK